ncbi:MAG: ankyrin repeat domain-containing protein [Planctomycetota bacterium]
MSDSFDSETPFFRALSTKYDADREQEAIEILNANPEIALLQWPGPDEGGRPHIKGATLLHYAANDGKLKLMARLVQLGSDVNASNANWYRSVLSWAANNARVDAIAWLLENGANPKSLDALHAAAWGGSSCGEDESDDYPGAIEMLVAAGADLNPDLGGDYKSTPLTVAIESGNERSRAAIERLGGRQ